MSAKRYRDRNCDLDALFIECEEWFVQRGYQTQVDKTDGMWLVQAKQNETWRTVVGASRAFNVLVQGHPNDFSLTLSTGEWATNLAAGGAAAILTGGATLLLSGITVGWSKKIEGDISTFLEQKINFGPRANGAPARTPPGQSAHQNPQWQQPQGAQPPQGQAQNQVDSQLAQLRSLYEAGILSQTEYDSKVSSLTRTAEFQAAPTDILAQLDAALAAGILTREEYEQKRAALVPAAAPQDETATAKMQQLESARAAGILSQEEFEAKRWELFR